MIHWHNLIKPSFLTALVIMTPVLALAGDTGTLENPLASDGVDDFLSTIVTVVQIIATPIVVFFVIYSGFLFVIARGNQETLDRAKRALLYAIIGAIIIAGAFAISELVENTTEEFISYHLNTQLV